MFQKQKETIKRDKKREFMRANSSIKKLKQSLERDETIDLRLNSPTLILASNKRPFSSKPSIYKVRNNSNLNTINWSP